jgi:hypothetical protein
MSRAHCRIEPLRPGGWRIIDLDSKNGTYFRWMRISQHKLVDGECFRLGRVSLTYQAGPFVPSPVVPKVAGNKLIRPADPHEALAGTVTDFAYVEPSETPEQEYDASPSPVHAAAAQGSTLEEISSSWESLVATAPRPARTAPPKPRMRFTVPPLSGRFPIHRQTPDVSLQVTPNHVPYLQLIPTLPRRPKANVGLAVGLSLAVCIATALVLLSGWALSG